MPGGAATGSVVQGKVLISAGQPANVVASGLTAVNLLSAAVLLLLPVLTIPALIIGPPPARQLQLGVLVSLILAVVIVAAGVTVLTWPFVVAATGRVIGRVVHLVRPSVTADGMADSLLAQRDRIAAAFQGHWWRAMVAAAANRMFDYAALVAALVAFGVHARPAEVLLAYVVAQAFAIIPDHPGRGRVRRRRPDRAPGGHRRARRRRADRDAALSAVLVLAADPRRGHRLGRLAHGTPWDSGVVGRGPVRRWWRPA